MRQGKGCREVLSPRVQRRKFGKRLSRRKRSLENTVCFCVGNRKGAKQSRAKPMEGETAGLAYACPPSAITGSYLTTPASVEKGGHSSGTNSLWLSVKRDVHERICVLTMTSKTTASARFCACATVRIFACARSQLQKIGPQPCMLLEPKLCSWRP